MTKDKKYFIPPLFVCALIFSQILFRAHDIFAQEKIIKVLSFNILHGETLKGDFDLDVIADVIIRTNPDLVALQEVDYKTNRARKYDLVKELAVRTGMNPLFGRAMFYDDGEYGEGILSKYTFIKTRNIPLPHLQGYEPRAALEITTMLSSGDTVCFIGTHLDHVESDTNRIMQVNEINKVFLGNKYPTILAGDLNDIPGSRVINTLERFWSSTYNKENPEPTFPSDNPKIKIDYVMFLPNDRWRVVAEEVIQDKIASDHCAYLVTLALVNCNSGIQR